MAKAQVGDRVGVIYGGSKETKVLRVLGSGVRVADEVPNAAAGGWMADALREANVPNPCIVLDNGDRVYGCECWWGPEAATNEQIALHAKDGYAIETVRIADMRAAARPGAPGGENDG